MNYFSGVVRGVTLTIGLLFIFCGVTKADAFINVPHFQQETPLWCWVAVAQQVIAYKKGLSGTPAQCAMVEAADGAAAGTCCFSAHPGCIHTGSFGAVANLIGYFGGAVSSYVLPANAYVIESTLNAGKPILAQIVSGSSSTHVVVIRGIQMGPNPMLIVNDPMLASPVYIPFASLASIWLDGIVVN